MWAAFNQKQSFADDGEFHVSEENYPYCLVLYTDKYKQEATNPNVNNFL
jgi:hypothetical protein